MAKDICGNKKRENSVRFSSAETEDSISLWTRSLRNFCSIADGTRVTNVGICRVDILSSNRVGSCSWFECANTVLFIHLSLYLCLSPFSLFVFVSVVSMSVSISACALPVCPIDLSIYSII